MYLLGKIRNLGFSGRSIRAILTWPLSCLFLGYLLWSITLSKLHSEKEAIRESAFKQAFSLSKAYAEQVSRSVERIDQITLNLKYYWKEMDGHLKLEKQFEEGLYPIASHLYVSILDRNGTLVSSTLNNASEIDARKTDYFAQHRSGGTGGLLISNPSYGKRYGKTVIRFSRSLHTSDGIFDGVVLVAIDPDYLASFAGQPDLGKKGFLFVGKNDGPFLVSATGESIGSQSMVFRAAPVFDKPQGTALMPKEHFIDNQSRIIAWQKLQHYPLVSTVGLAEQEIFAPYVTMSHRYIRIAIICSFLLFFVAIAGMYLSFRIAVKRRQSVKIKNAYRVATDGAREGFYMMRSLYNRERKIVDFLVEDCNERGAAYYGKSRAELVGSRLSEFSSGDYFQESLSIFTFAIEAGFYEDEYKVAPNSPLKAIWIHRRLVHSGGGLAVTLRDISDMKANEKAILRLANADAVTTLPNRHWLMNYLPTAVERARQNKTTLALLFIDLDDFKNINDTLGHAAGDKLLKSAALRLQSVLRPQDHIVRLGGDEFTVILERVENSEDAGLVAERMIKVLGESAVPSDVNNHLVYASIGISIFPQDGVDGETLLKHADIAMYAAKSNGKGHYAFYKPQLSESLLIRLNKEQALRKAIDRDEFVLYYQPRVDTFTGELRSMEALVRWIHPERGLIPPVDFIPMAEQTGLIVQLGEMVIKKACAQLEQWKLQNLPVVPVSINVSARQFNQGNLGELFASCMKHHEIDPSLIEIEITESCMIGEENTVNEELAKLEALGIKLLVDDFGTGYSSLSHLQRLDFDILKVDRAFTSQLGRGKEGEAFFMAILSMAHVLGMSVVAEGVETIEELRILQALSCNEIQGYFISKPVPADEMPELMIKRFLFPAFQPTSLQLI